MTPDRPGPPPLPEAARETLDELVRHLGLDLRLWSVSDGERTALLYPEDRAPASDGGPPGLVRRIRPRDGSVYELEVAAGERGAGEEMMQLAASSLERILDFAQEIRFFTFELSERYEEINLLYSISETLGSILSLEEGARVMLQEVCDVMGARRGSLWVHEHETDELRLVGSVGEGGLREPIAVSDREALTARVFREGRAIIESEESLKARAMPGVRLDRADTVLSVPIRYTPPEGEARTVGVINLIGRRHGGRFNASDQKLLSAIASQVGAALENNRLIRQSLARERMAREMELAHNLQMKLLPSLERLDQARVAARVEPAEMVGGDFYQVFRLGGERLGVMIGDVSSHGFPAALIMALSMSASSIYASESPAPGRVLRQLDDGLRDELESTEMYLSLFYGVIDVEARTLTWANAGHPHAFVVGGAGDVQRLNATDPPVGIAGPDSYGEEVRPWDPDTDLLLLFTDGLADALDSPECRNGEERLVEAVVELRDLPPGQIVDRVFGLAGQSRSATPPDDRTLLVLTSR